MMRRWSVSTEAVVQPEVINSFPEKRWAHSTAAQHGVHLRYGIGRLCSSYTLFVDPVEALFAEANWLENGVEPKRTGTLQGMPAVSEEQLEAWRFDHAVMELGAGDV